MQGIRVTELKTLLDYLKILRENETSRLPPEQLKTIEEKEAELRKIYFNYRISLQEVSESIQRFENEKQAVRIFLKKSKLFLKNYKKTSTNV